MSIELLNNCVTAEDGDTNEQAFQKGEWAGSQGYRRDQNPYPKGTSLREFWDGGWSSSYDELCGEPTQ